jgi:UDP-N-acetylglucosamine--N-acetylmuramyl-(pentapeptide) pyrophosphoryl-undecaprenol N-acetylglucosamine transferase
MHRSISEDTIFQPIRIVMAGGGTGGHLFPGIAIAQEFMTRNSANKIIFMSTGSPLERSVLSKAGFQLKRITAAGIKGRGLWNQAKSVSKIPKGILESMWVLKNFTPNLTVGLGSYSAGPVVIGAWLLRVTIVLHEQNILPGITNRILSRFADRLYISFENTKSHLDPRKVKWTGNPVRNEILAYADTQENTTGTAAKHGAFTIFVIGGSQGAHRLNIAVVEALEFIQQKDRLYFVHQTGETDEQTVKEAYRRKEVSSTVQAFFDDMAAQYHRADLIICRAGATTVAEIAALGKAAIFIPYPFAADNHQVLNAGSLSNEGAAEMIIEKNLSGKILSKKIDYFVANPDALKELASRAKRFGKPDAAKRIVDDCYDLVKSSNR